MGFLVIVRSKLAQWKFCYLLHYLLWFQKQRPGEILQCTSNVHYRRNLQFSYFLTSTEIDIVIALFKTNEIRVIWCWLFSNLWYSNENNAYLYASSFSANNMVDTQEKIEKCWLRIVSRIVPTRITFIRNAPLPSF